MTAYFMHEGIGYCLYSFKILRHLRIFLLTGFCYAGEHVSQRSACGARPSGAAYRGQRGANPAKLRSETTFCTPPRYVAERPVSTHSGA